MASESGQPPLASAVSARRGAVTHVAFRIVVGTLAFVVVGGFITLTSLTIAIWHLRMPDASRRARNRA